MNFNFKRRGECPHLESLQNHIDIHGSSGSLSHELTTHMYEGEGCSRCREFYESYGQFHSLLSYVSSGLESDKKDYERRTPLSFHPRFMNIAAAAALVIMVTILGFQGTRFYVGQQTIKEETHLFVQEIMNSSLLDPADFTTQIPPGWFDEEYL
jgi:hypothetical protein